MNYMVKSPKERCLSSMNLKATYIRRSKWIYITTETNPLVGSTHKNFLYVYKTRLDNGLIMIRKTISLQ